MRRLLSASVCIAVLVVSSCEETKVAEPSVTVRRADIDADSEEEIIIENEFLKLVALCPQTKGVEKYGSRFVQGGWITDVIFKPTGINAVIGGFYPQGAIDWDRHPTGLPTEFERRIRVAEDGKSARFLKIGVGEVDYQQTPEGRWRKADLVRAFPWAVSQIGLPDGSQKITFAQSARSDQGDSYTLTNSIIVPPRKPIFRIQTSLGNTGKRAISTDWYVHPFFSFGGLGGACWQCIPLVVGKKFVRTECFRLPAMQAPGTVWGWLTPQELGGRRWCATGCEKDGAFFGMSWDFRTLRVRNWLHGHTYAIEPFVKLDLKPGEATTWGVDVLVGRGMKGVNGLSTDGAVGVERFDGYKFRVSFYAAVDSENVVILGSAYNPEGRLIDMKKKTFQLVRATETAKAEFDHGRKLYGGTFEVLVFAAGEKILSCRVTCPSEAEDKFRRSWRNRARGRRVLLICAESAPGGSVVKERLYVESCLRLAGFEVESAEGPSVRCDMNRYRAAVVLGVEDLDLPNLRKWVEGGGGLFVTAPFCEELSKLLPVKTIGPVETDQWFWDCQHSGEEKAENVWSLRSHLETTAEHPVVMGLPFWPLTNQSIGRFYRVDVSRDGSVLLKYVPGGYPALVISRCGKGRIATLMNPILWGEPPQWILWGAFCEYHRELLQRIVAWVSDAIEE